MSSSKTDLAHALRQAGDRIVTVLCVVDREAGGIENLQKENLELRSLFTLSELKTASIV